jgi:energy-coupling factor transport system ATP-binding protein
MLDPQGRGEVMALLEDLHGQGITIIHITHRLEEIRKATRAVVLQAGRLIWDGLPEDLFKEPELTSWGLELPPVVSFWRRLRERGLCEDDVILTVEGLVNRLCR